jgi:hypothetical protein
MAQYHPTERRDSDISMISSIELDAEDLYPSQQAQVGPQSSSSGLFTNQRQPTETQPLVPVQLRPFQSCPASVHTTPIPARKALGHSNLMRSQLYKEPLVAVPAVTHYEAYPTPVTSARSSTQLNDFSMPVNPYTQALKIAHPAAVDPFASTRPQQQSNVLQSVIDHTTFCVSPDNHNGGVPPWLSSSAVPSQFPPCLSSTLSPIQHDHSLAGRSWGSQTGYLNPQTGIHHNWNQGQVETIDPRWVSPLSSLFPSPIGTPRTGSPTMPMIPQTPYPPITYSPDTSLIPLCQDMPAPFNPQVTAECAPVPGMITTNTHMLPLTDDGKGKQTPQYNDTTVLSTQSYPPWQTERSRGLSGLHTGAGGFKTNERGYVGPEGTRMCSNALGVSL